MTIVKKEVLSSNGKEKLKGIVYLPECGAEKGVSEEKPLRSVAGGCFELKRAKSEKKEHQMAAGFL